MNHTCVIDPVYLFNDFSRCMHGKLQAFDKYEIFRMLAIYDTIYTDKRWFLETAQNFGKDEELNKIFNDLFDRGILVDLPFETTLLEFINENPSVLQDCSKYWEEPTFDMSIALMQRLHENGIIVEYHELLPLQSVYTHLQFSLNNDSFLFFPMPELLICFTKALESNKVSKVKDNLKFWDMSKAFLKHFIPSLEIQSFEQYEKFLKSRESGMKIMQEMVEEFSTNIGSYNIRENEISKIHDYIVKSEQELVTIQNRSGTFSFGSDVITDIAGLMFTLPIGAIKTKLMDILESHEIKSRNLGWVVYGHSLKYFQKSQPKHGQCKLCNISIAELDNITEEEVNDILFKAPNLCLGHMIVYKNVRAFHRCYGIDLLRLIKENESDSNYSSNTSLGH